MRPVYVCALIAASLPGSSLAAVSPDVTVVLDIRGQLPPGTMHAMEAEAREIIGTSGIELGWSTPGEASAGSFNDLVVLTFRGSCILEPTPPTYDELGPYAFTRIADGRVQPFGEVDCDRIVNSVRAAISGGDYARADLLMGRALGRVVAHELVHMLTKSGQHGHEGVQKAALSGRQLISASLPLSAIDIGRLKAERPRARKAVVDAEAGGDSDNR